MKLHLLLEQLTPTSYDVFETQVYKLWGNSVEIRKVKELHGNGFYYCAKTPENWKKYPTDRSMSVGTYVPSAGTSHFLNVVNTPEEMKEAARRAASVKRKLTQHRTEEKAKANRIKTEFSVGMRVKLEAFEDEPEQTGEIFKLYKAKQLAHVLLDKKYVHSDDDGIREVPFDQLKPLVAKPPKIKK